MDIGTVLIIILGFLFFVGIMLLSYEGKRQKSSKSNHLPSDKK
jgi:hypothetical protein